MRIDSIQVSNKFYEWECDKIDFHSNLTLLVGTSGVGKTQILRGIQTIQKVANGESENGFEWDIQFISNSGESFIWRGAFELLEDANPSLGGGAGIDLDKGPDKLNPKIKYEHLESNGLQIIQRNERHLSFQGATMPKLSSSQSAVFILKEEDVMQGVYESFKTFIFKDHAGFQFEFGITKTPIADLLRQYPTIEKIRGSGETIKVKAILCSELKLSLFEEIKSRFISIFPQIEDIKIEQSSFVHDYPPAKDWTVPEFSIKEHGVQKWINEERMSSGMRRTIYHICELYLANEGSVILLDEFENSLGTNCIDILTEDLIHENSGIQYIATSHHPYIINNIPYEYWKIVTRKGGHIVVKDATDYNLGDSKQDAFIRLTRVLEAQYES